MEIPLGRIQRLASQTGRHFREQVSVPPSYMHRTSLTMHCCEVSGIDRDVSCAGLAVFVLKQAMGRVNENATADKAERHS